MSAGNSSTHVVGINPTHSGQLCHGWHPGSTLAPNALPFSVIDNARKRKPAMLKRAVPITLCLLLVPAAFAEIPNSQLRKPLPVELREHSRIDDARINESSGLALSQRRPDVLWTHNDSGSSAEVFAVRRDGLVLGILDLSPAVNVDWEDMAAFTVNGEPKLLLADIGDNYALRPVVDLYIVDEPVLPETAAPFRLNASGFRRIRVVYPDGPRDAESIAVDPLEGYIYLLTKRDAIPQLYRVPLSAGHEATRKEIVDAEALGPIHIPRAPQSNRNYRRLNQVTGMDFARDGQALALTTYTHVFIYARALDQSWQQALQQEPSVYRLPRYPMIEAVTFAAEAGSLWISSEKSPAPLARIALPPAAKAVATSGAGQTATDSVTAARP